MAEIKNEVKLPLAENGGTVLSGSPFNVAEKRVMLKALNGLAASILRAKTKDINDPELVAVRDKQLREIQQLITKEMFHEAR